MILGRIIQRSQFSWLLCILIWEEAMFYLPMVKSIYYNHSVGVFFVSAQSTLSVQIGIMCSCPYCTPFVLYKHIVHILLRVFQKCCDICDVQNLHLFGNLEKCWLQIQDPASTQPSSLVLSTLLILSPPISPVLSSIPSPFCSSPLWKPEVWDVWGLGPALLTRLSEDFSFNSCPLDWTNVPPFSHVLPGKLILWLGIWLADLLAKLVSAGYSELAESANKSQV